MAKEKIRGTAGRTRYEGKNGWAIMAWKDSSGTEKTVVGPVGHIRLGESFEAVGSWEDSKYGRQFRATNARVTVPQGQLGITTYLASLDGCGPELASRIFEAFGDESLAIAWGDEKALQSVDGIGKLTAQMIHKSAKAGRAKADVTIELTKLQVPPRLIPALIRRWQEHAADRIREDPYSLIWRFRGVGFQTADAIASAAGISLNDPRRLQAGILHVLKEASNDGHCYLTHKELNGKAPKLLKVGADSVNGQLGALESDGEIIIDGAAIYLRSYHMAEEDVAMKMAEIIGAESSAASEDLEPDDDAVPFELHEGQEAAVRQALDNKVCVLTGGPGTGKTTITKVILSAFEGFKVELASPTGKAAKRLQEATGCRAQTIHRLLEYHPNLGWRRNRGNLLDVDLVVIDEVSMVDVILMSRLLDAVPARARVIMVGDADQLPSVGAGKVLADMIDSGVIHVAELTQIHRQGKESRIVANAHRVNSGAPIEEPESREEKSDFWFVRRNEVEQAVETAVSLASGRLADHYGFRPEDVWVLTPQNVGPAGTQVLNEKLQKALNPDGLELEMLKGKGIRQGDRVMQLKNNYDLDVYNGDTVVILGQDTITETYEGRERERDVIRVAIDGEGTKDYDKSDIRDLGLAYAATVHKSQGSEYPAVIMMAHRTHYRMLQRRLLYTGMTRASKLLVMVGQDEAIQIATRNRGQDQRNSGLSWRLAERMAVRKEAV